LSPGEVAAALGVPVGTAKAWAHRARKAGEATDPKSMAERKLAAARATREVRLHAASRLRILEPTSSAVRDAQATAN